MSKRDTTYTRCKWRGCARVWSVLPTERPEEALLCVGAQAATLCRVHRLRVLLLLVGRVDLKLVVRNRTELPVITAEGREVR